ncbi:MAG: aldo/keto reductase [Abitibacteriaceae bacterium]|nr:aldo/keto reductase [Abditibacteriaceae bacterium]MBV9866592.1 aldo/keto reductase [Abditibacteriaceae bacterium]
MNYRRLGRSGLKVSEICLGAWINFGDRIEDEQTFAVLDAAQEQGIDFFDTADVYAGGKAEEVMGRWMKGKDRRTLTIATKGRGRMWPGVSGEGANRKHLMDACHDSLRRLQTDYIDLYQIHWPDPETPLEETMRTLDDLVRSGKVRYIGCSNFNSEMIGEAARISEQYNLNKFISLQPYYNMLGRGIEEKEIPRCVKEGLGLIPYSPLAQGLLSDKYLKGKVPRGSRAEGNAGLEKRLQENLPTMKALSKFARARDLTLSQLALVWLLHQPNMTAPIIGATRPEQVQENAKASGVKLTPEELVEIGAILKGPQKK